LPVPGWYLHRKFPTVGYKHINIPMVLIGMCIVPGSATSWITVSFIIILVSQYYIKRRHRDWFVKYNYLISTALDSGTSLMVFIIAMSLYGGASGVSHPFPTWWGNRAGKKKKKVSFLLSIVKVSNIIVCMLHYILDLKYIDHCCANCNT
jgi:hypothetical protein